MTSLLVRPSQRRALRRAIRIRCQAVALDGFRLVGERILDVSPRGLLLACDDGLSVGEEVIVSFQAPRGGPWIDAEAEVARVVEGQRPYDPGYSAGLRFVGLERRAREELLVRLAGCPPPIPRRALRVDYAETVRRIHLAA